MKEKIRLAATLLVLIVIFCVATFLTPVWFFLLVFVGRWEQAGYVLQAMDRLSAANVGFSGKNTISKECGLCETCWLCKPVCAALAWAIGKPHCKDEVKS